MTDPETRYELRSEAPLVPQITRFDPPSDRRPAAGPSLRNRGRAIVRPLLTLTRRGGR